MLRSLENENLRNHLLHTRHQWPWGKNDFKVSHGHGQLLEAMTMINLKPYSFSHNFGHGTKGGEEIDHDVVFWKSKEALLNTFAHVRMLNISSFALIFTFGWLKYKLGYQYLWTYLWDVSSPKLSYWPKMPYDTKYNIYGRFTHEPRDVTMKLWEPKRKCPKAVLGHLQNYVVWSFKCNVKSYVTGSSTKCYFNEISIHTGPHTW